MYSDYMYLISRRKTHRYKITRQLFSLQVEAELLRVLADVGVSVELPVELEKLFSTRARNLRPYVGQVRDLLQKFDVQSIVT